jgi:hypothetical protein
MSQVFKRIFNQGITKYPYTAYKNYVVTDTNHSSSFEISTFRGISPNGIRTEVSESKHQGIQFDSDLLTQSRAVVPVMNKIPQKIMWSTIDASCFKGGHGGHLLHPTASIISIPQNKFGLGIKPGSVTVTDHSKLAASSSLFLSESKHTNECGILYDTVIDNTNFVPKKNLKFYLGFQDGTFNTFYKKSKDDGPDGRDVYISKAKVVPGITTTGEVSSSGYGVHMTQQSHLYTTMGTSHYTFFTPQNDFGISLWVKLPPSQSFTDNTTNTLIKKSNQKVDPYSTAPSITRRLDTSTDGQFPFDISVHNQTAGAKNGQIVFQYSDGREDKKPIMTLSSSTKYNDNNWHNIIVTHNNSFNPLQNRFNFYIDGTLVGNVITSQRRTFSNEADITIMCDNGGLRKFTGTSGSVDEVRIYNRHLTPAHVGSLSNNHVISGSAYQTRDVGYVYYQKGLIVVTDPRPKYQNCFLGNGDFDYTDKGYEFTYKSTKKIEMQSILCEIGKNEYNVSQNNTLRKGGTEDNHELKAFVTGSDFRPYITSVGLYNDTGDLLAIGKLGSPLKKRQDVDVTIDIRLDFE